MIFYQTYAESQNEVAIVTPSSNKKIYIWQVIIETATNASCAFLTSAKEILILANAGSTGAMNVDKVGATDEAISLTCGANTTIKILYDEVD